MAERIVLSSFAKINFYLDVIDKRDDGFNNIETIFQTLDLADRLTMERTEQGLEFTCDDAALSQEPDNLVLRAARALIAHSGREFGARIHLEKRIPVAAGLAGGSGDAAAALAGLNELWAINLDDVALAQLALGIGSDVPYCLCGGTAMATGRGEEITRLPEVPETWLVLLHPNIGVSAAWVYRHPQLARSGETRVSGRTPQFTRALASLEAGDLAACVFNRMEGVVFDAHPELAEWKRQLLAAGCPAAAMSGSGPTVFGICTGEAHARSVVNSFAGVRGSVVRTVPHGLCLETES